MRRWCFGGIIKNSRRLVSSHLIHGKQVLRQFGTALLIFVAAFATAGARNAPAVTGTCAPKDATSARLAEMFKSLVGRSDMGATVIRTQLGIMKVTPVQVFAVTDKAVCAKAADAMFAQVPAKQTHYTLYIVALGTSFGVMDNTITEPGKGLAYVFDSKWKYVGNQAM
jgi:hypothetical protein